MDAVFVQPGTRRYPAQWHATVTILGTSTTVAWDGIGDYYKGQLYERAAGKIARAICEGVNTDHVMAKEMHRWPPKKHPGEWTGVFEWAGCGAFVIWPYRRFFEWLMHGFPTPSEYKDGSGDGLWVTQEDCIWDGRVWGQEIYMQMRRLGVAREVINGERRMTEQEHIDAAAAALRNINGAKHAQFMWNNIALKD